MSKLMDKMLKAGSVKHTAILSESSFFGKKDLITTKVPALNIAFSGEVDGGMIPGLTVIAGPSRHYKSNLALIGVQAYLNKYPDAICLFYDAEFGITPEYLAVNGVDTSRVLHIPIEHIEQLKFDIVKRLEEIERGDKVIIFVDSLGNLASKKETEDALDEKSVADMSRSKAIKSLFRIVTPHLTTKDIPCLVINHTYQTMEMFSKAVISGGCLEAGTKIRKADGKFVNVEDMKVGDIVDTLLGPKEVTHVWDPETLDDGTPECFRLTFDDGFSVVCSADHKFLVDGEWIRAEDMFNSNIEYDVESMDSVLA